MMQCAVFREREGVEEEGEKRSRADIVDTKSTAEEKETRFATITAVSDMHGTRLERRYDGGTTTYDYVDDRHFKSRSDLDAFLIDKYREEEARSIIEGRRVPAQKRQLNLPDKPLSEAPDCDPIGQYTASGRPVYLPPKKERKAPSEISHDLIAAMLMGKLRPKDIYEDEKKEEEEEEKKSTDFGTNKSSPEPDSWYGEHDDSVDTAASLSTLSLEGHLLTPVPPPPTPQYPNHVPSYAFPTPANPPFYHAPIPYAFNPYMGIPYGFNPYMGPGLPFVPMNPGFFGMPPQGYFPQMPPPQFAYPPPPPAPIQPQISIEDVEEIDD